MNTLNCAQLWTKPSFSDASAGSKRAAGIRLD